VINVVGKAELVPLDRIKTERRRLDGHPFYNLYDLYRIPDSAGSGTIRLRLNQTEEDRAQIAPFNREEYLHAIAQGDADFGRLYGLREDAESGNAMLKLDLPLPLVAIGRAQDPVQ
jgi:hypothetical protein